MEEHAQVRAELDRALQALEELGREETYIVKIRKIVLTNLERGRVRHYLDGRSPAAAGDYVMLVATEYDAQHTYVERVQEARDAVVWEPLFEKLQKWAYNLIRSRLQSNPHDERMEHAVNCAADAGAAIANGYFPYDTAFDAWMYVLLSYTVNKYVGNLPGFSENGCVAHIQLDRWQEWSENIPDPTVEHALSRYERQQMLFQAIQKLPSGQQEVIALLFSANAYSYAEIAKETGRSYSALYKAKFDALANLRRILSEVEYLTV